MRGFSTLVVVASLSFIAGVGLTYVARTPWSSDMADQPSLKPQERPLPRPVGSVPTDMMNGSGTAPAARPAQSAGGSAEMDAHGLSGGAGDHHDHLPATHDHASDSAHSHDTPGNSSHQHGTSAAHSHGATSGGEKEHSHAPTKASKGKTKSSSGAQPHSHNAPGHSHGDGNGHTHGTEMPVSAVTNPIKPTEISVQTGNKLFNIYCTVCHGNEGRGGMPMESKLPGIPKFTAKLLRSVDDNHMFSMVTSGHGPMPGYAEALTPEERWHVTNYVRTLPEKLAAQNTAPIAQRGSR